VRFCAPSTASLELAPCEARCYLRFGSALRLSQPLSGFLACSSFAALFRTATVRGVLPSEASPRRNRAPLSRSRAPLRLSTGVPRRARSRFITAGFTNSHTRKRSCLDSPTTMRFIFTHRGALPCSSELVRAEPSCSASFTHFEALFLLQVRSRRPRLPRPDGRSSRRFLPP